jgi:putative transposase
VTVSLEPSGKYFISFLVKETIEPMKSAGRAVGIDVGIKDLMVLSTGTKFDNPKLMLEKANRALKQAQKQLSRKKRGSKNREKARLAVAKAYAKVTRIKTNYYHNISTYLVRNFDEIFMEDLNVNGMLKNRRLSAAIHEASWSSLISMIKYKSDWNSRNFHQISRWFPSSKTCSVCSHVLDTLALSTRDWVCPVCGHHHDRDLNAAVNILNQGQLDCYDTILFGSATDLMGASLPMALMKHSSKIERSVSKTVRVGSSKLI